jgi:hypothetical protein
VRTSETSRNPYGWEESPSTLKFLGKDQHKVSYLFSHHQSYCSKPVPIIPIPHGLYLQCVIWTRRWATSKLLHTNADLVYSLLSFREGMQKLGKSCQTTIAYHQRHSCNLTAPSRFRPLSLTGLIALVTPDSRLCRQSPRPSHKTGTQPNAFKWIFKLLVIYVDQHEKTSKEQPRPFR